MDAIGTLPQVMIPLYFLMNAKLIFFLATVILIFLVKIFCEKHKVKNKNKWIIIVCVFCCMVILYIRQTH